jgi:hypothetical protein
MKLVDGYLIALEIFHTHATGCEKVNSTRQCGLAIAEFRAEDVLNMQPGDMLENLQMRVRFCDSCLLNKALEWLRVCYMEELESLLTNAEEIETGYEMFWLRGLRESAKQRLALRRSESRQKRKRPSEVTAETMAWSQRHRDEVLQRSSGKAPWVLGRQPDRACVLPSTNKSIDIRASFVKLRAGML